MASLTLDWKGRVTALADAWARRAPTFDLSRWLRALEALPPERLQQIAEAISNLENPLVEGPDGRPIGGDIEDIRRRQAQAKTTLVALLPDATPQLVLAMVSSDFDVRFALRDRLASDRGLCAVTEGAPPVRLRRTVCASNQRAINLWRPRSEQGGC